MITPESAHTYILTQSYLFQTTNIFPILVHLLLNPSIRPPDLALLITNNRQIHIYNILRNPLRIPTIALIIRPQTLLHIARLTLTQPPLRHPLAHKLRFDLNKPPRINQRRADLSVRFLIREHVNPLEDHNLRVGVHTFAVGDRFEFTILVDARAVQLMPGSQLAQLPQELNDSVAIEGVKRALALLLLVGQNVRGFDETFDGDGLGFEAALGYCVGDGGRNEGFAAAGAAGKGYEGAAVGLLLGVQVEDVLREEGGEGFGFHFRWVF